MGGSGSPEQAANKIRSVIFDLVLSSLGPELVALIARFALTDPWL